MEAGPACARLLAIANKLLHYTPLTRNTGITPYVIDEFGLALGIALVIIAMYFWHRRSEVAGPVGAPAKVGLRSVPVAS